MPKPTPVLIDFEFTGLDNTFITDNQIIQMKALNVSNGKHMCQNYKTTKPLSAHVQLSHSKRQHRFGNLFSTQQFTHALKLIEVEPGTDYFFGYGVQKDREMLAKYDIRIQINDIREMLQLSRHEYRMATEGSGLEEAYFIAFGSRPPLNNHNGIPEILVMRQLYKYATRIKKNQHLTLMPFGHCAGMPLSQYVMEYRRAADGYRFNNNDILSRSLSNEIENYELEIMNDDDDN